MAWDPTGDAWLAGFSAGEGCFHIKRTREDAYQPRFEIYLRFDDHEVLQALRGAFGGKIYTSDHTRTDGSRRQPSVSWNVFARDGLVKLVQYFERFPLHAKKARDYQIWRIAVSIYLERGGGSDRRLGELRDALIAGRSSQLTPEIVELCDSWPSLFDSEAA